MAHKGPINGTPTEPLLPGSHNQSYIDILIDLTRRFLGFFSNSWVLSAWLQFVSAGFAQFQAIFSFMVFSGLVDCDKDGEARERDYTIVYFTMMAIFCLINFPSVFYEQWRKAYKYIYYPSKGTASSPYPPSPALLKAFNSAMQILSNAMTGWNIGDMLNKSPKAPVPANLVCVREGWENLLHDNGKALGFGVLGMAICGFLAGPQTYAYYSKKPPAYGSKITALGYAIYRIIMTFFPIIRDVVKNPAKLSMTNIFTQVVCGLLVTFNRYKVYERSNRVTIVINEMTSEQKKIISDKKQKISALKTQYEKINADFKKNNRSTSLSQQAKDIQVEISAAEKALHDLERAFSDEKIIYENEIVSKAGVDNLFERSEARKFIEALLCVFGGSFAVAFITGTALLTMFEALGIASAASLGGQFIAWFIAASFGLARLGRFLLAFFGGKQLEECDYQYAINALGTDSKTLEFEEKVKKLEADLDKNSAEVVKAMEEANRRLSSQYTSLLIPGDVSILIPGDG